MLFNSISYGLFLPLVFLVYWIIGSKRRLNQNLLLLMVSYVFYGFWDWRFLFLLLFSTGLDYIAAIRIEGASTPKRKAIWLWISISINLGFLAVFKYFNFFSDNFAVLMQQLGWQINPASLSVILPVGISFYTFHGLSYIIDTYQNRIRAERNFIDYSLFVSFFPLLVAGPIERATHLLPQLKNNRVFNANLASEGLRQMLWGYVKKVVIADHCADYANQLFNNPEAHSGGVLALGAILFAFQIYGDFSGYSDIAIGTAKLFGIDLLRNFAYPYFSRDIAEFWRRWHISLSSWFRDYVYIPLGGSRTSRIFQVRNILVIFLLSGFWHGANWTFIFWGLLNALFIIPSVLSGSNRYNMEIVAKGRLLPNLRELLSITLTFGLTTFAWIFFRAATVTDAIKYIQTIVFQFFTAESIQELLLYSYRTIGVILFVKLLIFITIEWVGREYDFALNIVKRIHTPALRWSVYYLVAICIFLFATKEQTFIYFQF